MNVGNEPVMVFEECEGKRTIHIPDFYELLRCEAGL